MACPWLERQILLQQQQPNAEAEGASEATQLSYGKWRCSPEGATLKKLYIACCLELEGAHHKLCLLPP